MKSFLSYLNATADRLPDKLSFSDGENGLTFAELRRAVAGVGACLKSKGAMAEPVGVLMERSAYEIAAFLGVLEAGCFYVPLDEQMPRERLDRIVRALNPRFILTDQKNLTAAEGLCPAAEHLIYSRAAAFPGPDRLREESAEDALSYVVFTSGSTGEPKGVSIRESALLDYAATLPVALDFDESLIFGIQSPLYFDAWLKELLGVMVKGATAYLLPRELFVNPVSLIEYINERKINALCWVSSAFSLVSRLRTFYAVVPEHLKLMCFGSEVFPVKQLTAWQKACPDARIFQLYGATECTGMSFYHPVLGPQAPDRPVPVGKPFPGTKLYLLDDEGRLADEGEIVIGGPSVMAGYYKDPVRTAAALIPDPADPEGGQLCYRTGDIGRLDENGDLIFIGRRDQQIKHMGHRVELGEIEAAALSLKGVHEAVCMYVADRQRIDLFYTGPAQPWDLVVGLKVKLPGYMTPNRTEQRSELPHLPNGKIDRRAIEQKEYGK